MDQPESVTFDRLGDLSDSQLDAIVAMLEAALRVTVARPTRASRIFEALFAVLDDERRRRGTGLRHSAPIVCVALPTAGELGDDEMRDLMRWMQEGRTATGGTPAVAAVFDAVLRALSATRLRQRATLERMGHDLG